MDMSSFLISDYLRAEDLEDNVVIEAKITDVENRTFEERGKSITRPIIRLEDGRGVVLNQTRLRIMITAYGPNSNNWLDQPIRVRRGETLYAGKQVATVEVEAAPSARIAAGE